MFTILRPSPQQELPINVEGEFVRFKSGFVPRWVSFRRSEIVKVTVWRSLSFWRSGYRVVFYFSWGQKTAWVPSGWTRVFPKVCEHLKLALPGKYFEVGG